MEVVLRRGVDGTGHASPRLATPAGVSIGTPRAASAKGIGTGASAGGTGILSAINGITARQEGTDSEEPASTSGAESGYAVTMMELPGMAAQVRHQYALSYAAQQERAVPREAGRDAHPASEGGGGRGAGAPLRSGGARTTPLAQPPPTHGTGPEADSDSGGGGSSMYPMPTPHSRRASLTGSTGSTGSSVVHYAPSYADD